MLLDAARNSDFTVEASNNDLNTSFDKFISVIFLKMTGRIREFGE